MFVFNQILVSGITMLLLATACDLLITIRQSPRENDIAAIVLYAGQGAQKAQKIVLLVKESKTLRTGMQLPGKYNLWNRVRQKIDTFS